MRTFAALALALVVASCGDTHIYEPGSLGPTAPAPPAPPRRNAIEFRVNGSASSARIRYANPIDGQTQVVTALPYVVEASTTLETIFLSLDVTPIAFPFFTPAPFLSAQIFVNGSLFREATSADTSLNTLSVSGTWRAD